MLGEGNTMWESNVGEKKNAKKKTAKGGPKP